MYKAFGIVSSSGRNIYVDGMQDYRPIGAFSFLGRYRVIDFPISNMTNSDIDRIQVYINNKPRSVVEHLGTGRHYNINSKSGKLQLLFSEHNNDNDIYNTDISCYLDNMESLSRMNHPYVVIAPSYMVYSIDFDQFLHTHIESGADVTLLYHAVDNAKEAYQDIIQAVSLGTPEGLIAFCKGIQAAAPVDSYVDPEPWDMPGYDSQVIMAAGAFVQGSSIELSADGPMKPPYAVYFQGGLTWEHAKLGVLMSLQKMVDKGLVTL